MSGRQDRVSNSTKTFIVKRYLDGDTQTLIAERFGLTLDTVHRIIKKYKEYLAGSQSNVQS